MAGSNTPWLEQLPFYSVTTKELQIDFGIPVITMTDFINTDFLDDLKTLYHSDVYRDLNFHYYTPNSFNLYADKKNIGFSLFHLNIHSLNRNGDELCQFLNTINHDFDVLILSEIWSCNIAHFSNLISGYKFYYDVPDSSDVGGVGIYVRSNLSHNIVDSYRIPNSSDCRVENLWMEVTKDCSKYIVGGIYRHPGHKISDFLQKFDNVLSQI